MEELYPEPDDQSQAVAPSEEGYDETETVLIPKSMLGDKKPGDKCTVEIVSAFEDEFEVKVSSEEPETETEDQSVDAQIDAAALPA